MGRAPAPARGDEQAFAHHNAGELALLEGKGKRVRLIAGSLYSARSPVGTLFARGFTKASTTIKQVTIIDSLPTVFSNFSIPNYLDALAEPNRSSWGEELSTQESGL